MYPSAMYPRVKICGLSSAGSVDAAVAAGAAFAGFVFYPPSPRNVEAVQVARLIGHLPEEIRSVGVFVNPDDALLEAVLATAPLDVLQLHGGETPDRVAEVSRRFGLPVIKAISVETAEDVSRSAIYSGVAEYLLFDARAPEGDASALPGGNGLSFDHTILQGYKAERPWFLSGGLSADNVAAAVELTSAPMVDVSSGVESSPGRKDKNKIKAFLAAAGVPPRSE